MWRICTKLCSNFLFGLLLFSFSTKTISTFTIDDCGKINETFYPHCSCWVVHNHHFRIDYEIECPVNVKDSNIEVRISHSTIMEVKITINDIEGNAYKLLPEMNFGDVYSLSLSLYPVLGEPISRLLHHLGMTKIEYLDITYSGKDNFTSDHLSGLTDLKKLSLYGIDFSLLPEDLFEDLQKLQDLSFHIGNIRNVPNILAPLENLKHLNLSSENLEQLPVGVFDNLRNMEYLQIVSQLRNISKDLFSGTTSLKSLDLSRNKIESLQHDVFSLLPNLEYIYLDTNYIQELPSRLFTSNKALKIVNIINNHVPLKTLPPALFAGLFNLQEVDISSSVMPHDNLYAIYRTPRILMSISCGLDNIPHDLFANSTQYHQIVLANNKLASVDGTLFAHQMKLNYLNLTHNILESLPDELFDNKLYLLILDLSYNQLAEISSGIFDSLSHLQELYIGNNRLVTINPDAFIKTKYLKVINMKNNQINLSDIVNKQIESKPINELKSPFQFLKELRILNLRNNTLCYVFSDWRNKMENLKLLDLSYNNITSLSHSDLLFHSKTDLSIDLSYNHISQINFQNITMWDTSIKSVTSVQLNNNPLNCDCNLFPFVQHVKENKTHRKLNLTTEELLCDTPENMKYLNVRNVVPKVLLCPLESPYCPHECRCSKRTQDLVLVVNCNNKNLKEVPALPRVRLLLRESIELHIENNELYKLPTDFTTTGYADVTEIHAAGNRLYQIDLRNLPRNLTYLDLSRNTFQELNNEVLNFFNQSNSSRQISLSKNPWNCECKNKPLLVFAAQSNTKITDVDSVYCVTPTNQKMTDYFFNNDICQDDQSMTIALIVGLTVVGFSIMLIAVLYYKYQTEVKVWMYRYRICSCCVNEKELDKDKLYDAFISYSHRDELFIAEHLVRELEEGPIPFKLCIYVRDFIIGECIPDQIINAIGNSRRTIIVLSENFIYSAWARLEFRLAHKAALNEGRTRVIVIIYGKIQDIKTLDEDLQAYLKMNIYLEWGDPRFWDRLRYAMPHKSRKLKSVIQSPLMRNKVDNIQLIDVPRAAEECNELI